MTARESLAYFLLEASEEEIKRKISKNPHSNFFVWDGQLDMIKGFVNAKKRLLLLINGHSIRFKNHELIQTCFIIPGFMMFILRRIPKCTDFVNFAGYKFEVVDVDDFKVDQLLVTRHNTMDAVEDNMEADLHS